MASVLRITLVPRITLVLCLLLALAPPALAGEKADGHRITDFASLNRTAYFFEGDPSEAELARALPKTLKVSLDGSDKRTEIPVSWEAVEDYEDTAYYFYSMKPVWSDDYTLPEGLDPVTDVPWIAVFRQVSRAQIDEGEKAVCIPVADPAGLTAEQTDQARAAGAKKAAATTDSNAEKIYSYLTDTMGLNMAAACGVMTNLYAESGMKPNNLENTYNILYGLTDAQYTKRVNKGKKNKGKYTSGFGKTRYFINDYSGYGLCQWTSSGRRKGLLKAAVKKDVSIANLKMQLGFLQSELEDSYPQVWATLKGVPDSAAGVYLSAAHFCASFEIPANTNNTAASRARTALSSYWKTYSGKTASASGKSYLGLCGYSYPGTIHKGKAMTVSGQVISNYNIKSVKARILDSKGKVVYKKTRRPYSRIWSLYALDKAMKFSKLSAGDYTYQITARDSFGKTVTVRHAFTVSKTKDQDIRRGCAVKDLSTGAGSGAKKK